MRGGRSVLAGVLAVCVCTAVVASETGKGAADMMLTGGSQGSVPFPHHRHQSVISDCQTCHVDFPQKAGIIEEMKAGGTLKKKQIMNRHCVKCHKENKDAGRKTGPLTCTQCHVK